MMKTYDPAQDARAARLATEITAFAYGLDSEAVRSATRGSPQACKARQAAMYLTYVAFGMSLARVAAAFGRDRSTASHACHRTEDRRDDPEFDRCLGSIEALLRAAPVGPS